MLFRNGEACLGLTVKMKEVCSNADRRNPQEPEIQGKTLQGNRSRRDVYAGWDQRHDLVPLRLPDSWQARDSDVPEILSIRPLAGSCEREVSRRKVHHSGRSIPKVRMKRWKAQNACLLQQMLDILISLKACVSNSRYLLPSRCDADAPMSGASLAG
jgi:hypothetical protein